MSDQPSYSADPSEPSDRQSVLQLVVRARETARSLLTRRELLASEQLEFTIKMLDEIETEVRAGQWPPPPGTYDGPQIGLYAIRNLEEIASHISSLLCSLANLLNGVERR